MKDCIFCKLQNNNNIIIENKYFYSILDLNPVSIGHTLIISKRHIVSIEDLNENEIKEFFVFQKKVVNKIKTIDFKKLYKNILNKSNDNNSIFFIKKILSKFRYFNGIKDYNLGINNGKFAGRTVNHLHIHIIPRFEGDVKNYVGGVRHVIPELGNYKENSNKKLIRDNIPEIIEKKGRKADCYIADDKEYRDELFKKLLEESKEVFDEKKNKEKLKEEIGDLLEVIESILKLENIKMKEVLEIKENKKKKNGGFDKRIILNIE